jgi:tetratricopeptide (TPR) repeat protein/transcriptional regulator with XRE-family HTH domain
VPEPAAVTFASLLRQLRTDARLTQEELAEKASLSARTISDLERSVSPTARLKTARRLAAALGLEGAFRARFEAAAQGGVVAAEPVQGSESSGVAAATWTLPRDISSFTGRESELQQLVGSVTGTVDSSGVVAIHAIGGMAGIGKTALAVHAAHRLASQFPDGQIFLPLHGHTPGHRPVDPADALASLLLTVGVIAQKIPPGLEERTGLWRDHLVGKRLMLLLDDAADSAQVRPLLPGTAGSRVLVTSRRRLTALEDARVISLGTLTAKEAGKLLTRLAARPDPDPGDASVAEITRLCGYLPLAIGMLARQLHHHPAWSMAELAADLAAARDRLELMQAENLSVAAAFDLSYQDLTAGQQRLFRRLGVLPGNDVDGYAAAALDDTDLATARRQLGGLYDHYLLTEPTYGRYRFHDLIREHARTLAAADPAAERDAATSRLLDYYLHTARAADQHLVRRTATGVPPALAAPPACAPALPTRQDALAWMDAEHLNLHAAAGYAAAHGWPGHAIALPAALNGFLRSQSHWTEALALHHAAFTAARDTGDRPAAAGALTDLGQLRYLTGDFSAAADSLTEALAMQVSLGSRLGEANARTDLGEIQLSTGDYAAATVSLSRALELFRDLGDRLGEAHARNDLGVSLYLTGQYPAATVSLSAALATFREVGYQLGEASAVSYLGAVQQASGDYPAATASLSAALVLYRDLGERLEEAGALLFLGAVQHVSGSAAAASASLSAALALYRELGDRFGEASALSELGLVQQASGEYAAAGAGLNRALELYRELGSRNGEADALARLGAVHRLSGEYAAADAGLNRALELYRELGSRSGEADALVNLGDLALASATVAQARTHHEQALAIAVEIAAQLEEARAREGIGQCDLREGRAAEGVASLRQALAIYQRIGSPHAGRVATALARQPG